MTSKEYQDKINMLIDNASNPQETRNAIYQLALSVLSTVSRTDSTTVEAVPKSLNPEDDLTHPV